MENCRNSETLLAMISLTHLVLEKSNCERGLSMLYSIEKNLADKKGEVGHVSEQLLERFNWLLHR